MFANVNGAFERFLHRAAVDGEASPLIRRAGTLGLLGFLFCLSVAPNARADEMLFFSNHTAKDGAFVIHTYWDKDGDGIADYLLKTAFLDDMIFDQKVDLNETNPPPDDPSGEYVFPWEKNPLNPGQSTAPLHPAVIGLERALQMDGGGALVHGKRGLGTLVNPADDDNGNGGPKPKTQTTGGIKAGLATLGLADLAAVEEQVGLANGLGLSDAAYVQLHNPAETQGGPVTDGDDDAPGTAGPQKDGPMTPGGNGMPSLWDLAHQSLVNPAPFDSASSANRPFVLLPPSANSLQARAAANASPLTGSSSFNWGSFGGGAVGARAVPR